MSSIKEILTGNTAVVEQATSLLSTLGDRDGGYIWKKYSYTLPASDIYALSGSDGRIIYYSDAYTLTDSTYALVNPKSISIWASDTSPVAKLAGKYFLVATTSGTMMYRGIDNITTVLSGSDLYLRNVHVISNITSDVLTEIGYAVADSEGSYPDGGELDGYWYEAYKGSNVIIDGVQTTETLNLERVLRDTGLFATLPDTLDIRPNIAILDDVLYAIDNENMSIYENGSWSIITMPYDTNGASIVVYNNEIHIIAGNSTKHYKLNSDRSFTSVSTTPVDWMYPKEVVYNNEIHILGDGASGTKYHYKWDGSAWTQLSNLPVTVTYASMVFAYNNELHLVCNTTHYKLNGTSWETVCTLPVTFSKYGSVGGGDVVFLDTMFALTGNSTSAAPIYKWTGSTWVEVITATPVDIYCNAVATDKAIYYAKGENIYKIDYYYKGEVENGTVL